MDAGEQAGKTYFVTRHPGAVEWAKEQHLQVDAFVTHLDPETIVPGDTVIGSLPVNLAAHICERGAEYRHLTLELPEQARGEELDTAAMYRYGARIETFSVRRKG